MTHDELLDKINEASMYANGNVEPALCAVVELHREVTDTWNKEQVCFACNSYSNPIKYPCKTIQAIEKELS